MELANAPRKDTQLRVLSGGDGVERDKIREDNNIRPGCSMAKSDSEKGATSKIPRLAHRPPRSHRPSSVASSSSTDTDHSAVKDEVAKPTSKKLDPALFLNAACLVVKHDGKHSPVFSATDKALQLLSLRRKNRTKSDSCVSSSRQVRKGLGHNRVKSDTSAIKACKRRKTPRLTGELSSDLSSTSSDSSKPRDRFHCPSSSETSDSLEFSDHALRKCRSSIGKEGDDEDTDDSTVIESPPSFLELKKSLNAASFLTKMEKQKDSQETVLKEAVASNATIHENNSAQAVCKLEQTPETHTSGDNNDPVTVRADQKAPTQDRNSSDNLKRSFSSVETNTRSGQSSHCNVDSTESSEDYYSCRSFCSIDPGVCPSMCTMQDIGKVARHELKLANNNLQGLSPGEHRLRSMQLQSRIADMIKFGKSWLQTAPKGSTKWHKRHKIDGKIDEYEEKGVGCRLSKSQSSVMGINPPLFEYAQKPNPLPRTIYFCKKNEEDGHVTTSDVSSENSYDDWHETRENENNRATALSERLSCRNMLSCFSDGPEIIPKEKLRKEDMEKHSIQLDVVDRNTVGIQVNLFSILEFQTRFGVDIGIQVNDYDMEFGNLTLFPKIDRSTSVISLKGKRSRLPICNISKFTCEQPLSVSTSTTKLPSSYVDEIELPSSELKIDLSGLTDNDFKTTEVQLETKGSKTTQVSLDAKGSRTTQVSLDSKGSRTTQVSLDAKGSRTTLVSLDAKGSRTTQVSLEGKASGTTQVSLEVKDSRTTQISLDEKLSKTTQISLNEKGSRPSHISLSEKGSRTTYISLEEKGSTISQVQLESKLSGTTCKSLKESQLQTLKANEEDDNANNAGTLDQNAKLSVNIDDERDKSVGLNSKSTENLALKDFNINISQIDAEDLSSKEEVVQEKQKADRSIEKVGLLPEVKLDLSPKITPKFKSFKKPSPKLSPKITPKVVVKQSPKPLTRFTSLKKPGKHNDITKPNVTHTQAKSEHAVAAKNDPCPNTAKSDQGVRSTSQTTVYLKKTPKIPRRIPVPAKEKTIHSKDKTVGSHINNRLMTGIDGTDAKNDAKSSIQNSQSATEMGKNDRNKPENSVQQNKDKSSRIPRQDTVSVPKPKIPGSSRDARCASANNKTMKRKPFSAL